MLKLRFAEFNGHIIFKKSLDSYLTVSETSTFLLLYIKINVFRWGSAFVDMLK